MSSYFAHKMVVLMSIYIIFYTIFLGIASAAIAEKVNTESYSPDINSIVQPDAGFAYSDSMTSNSSTIDITRPQMTISWLTTFGNILLGGNVGLYSDSTFIMSNLWLIRVMFWLPLLVLVFMLIITIVK